MVAIVAALRLPVEVYAVLVDSHLHAVPILYGVQKLEARNRVELAMWAHETRRIAN